MSDASDYDLSMLLRALVAESNRFLEIFSAAHELHPTDMTALNLIMTADSPMTPGSLAKALNLSASATTSVLDRLERAGHVVRDRSPDDRRRVELRVLSAATALASTFFQPLAREFSSTWEQFSAEDRQVVARFLTTTTEATARVRAAVSPPADDVRR
ncbi:MarR family winged helix-turn-helix transcriptional regulator [Lentzea flava]|uniref:MarR family transcriptional regulator n=1 Tax=Lentzea flava TaxID=103732 RepID=A0ABQ2UUG9_9PSEU|nr:MarR family transcriptional regulator [Lentzea flava]MCP2201999.1 DNA-binding transcriptional regulator, MarR family [Lentzea flava]GGU54233.1 MarR family transcriptional regulator [Lentzea flava]